MYADYVNHDFNFDSRVSSTAATFANHLKSYLLCGRDYSVSEEFLFIMRFIDGLNI